MSPRFWFYVNVVFTGLNIPGVLRLDPLSIICFLLCGYGAYSMRRYA